MIMTMVTSLKGQNPHLIFKKKSSGMSITSTMLFGSWNSLSRPVNICFEGPLSVSSLLALRQCTFVEDAHGL